MEGAYGEGDVLNEDGLVGEQGVLGEENVPNEDALVDDYG